MLLEDLRKVAGIVAREIYKSLGRGTWKELSIGEGGDLTTEMDLMAEELVIHGLEELGHSFVLVSEESGERVFGRNPEFTVFLDPIDGTSNAIEVYLFHRPLYLSQEGEGDLRTWKSG